MRRYLAAFGFGMMLLLGACAGTDDPAAVIEAYVEAYNAGDADAIATLFAEDAVITGHPGGTFTGISEIQALHEDEADGTVAYTISNVAVEGGTVTWDHVWSGVEDDGRSFENCVDGHNAQISDGRILSWQWPTTNFQCP